MFKVKKSSFFEGLRNIEFEYIDIMLTKVFYNDECAVCNIEIDHYKKKCATIEWAGFTKLTIL